jgi:hypothetical protein
MNICLINLQLILDPKPRIIAMCTNILY